MLDRWRRWRRYRRVYQALVREHLAAGCRVGQDRDDLFRELARRVADGGDGQARRCRCGHDRASHDHYHAGTYCGLCACGSWRRRWWPRRKADGRG